MSKKLLLILFLLSTKFVSAQQLMATATLTKDFSCVENATITVTATGGTPDYEYSINDSPYQSTNVFANLQPGNYVFNVRDNNNNTATSNLVIVSPIISLEMREIVTNVRCFGGSDGIIDVFATWGGTPPYHYSLIATSTILTGPQVSNTFTNLSAGMYTVQVTDGKQCTSFSNVVITQPTPLIASCSVTSDGTFGTLTITATGGVVPYQYSIDGVSYTTANVFVTSLMSGPYTYSVKDNNGCVYSGTIWVPTPPTINNPTQTFPQGATLADISVTGQNIKWYATQSGNRAMASELPLSTVLVDGTTYYATQTVNGIESQRAQITVKVGTLSNQEVSFQQLKVFPIPAKEQLKITNATPISSVVIYNYLGTAISRYDLGTQNMELDITSLASGVYFAKLKTADAEKTVKFVKE